MCTTAVFNSLSSCVACNFLILYGAALNPITLNVNLSDTSNALFNVLGDMHSADKTETGIRVYPLTLNSLINI